jgi:hypothetical protein
MKLRGNIIIFLLIAGFAHGQTIVSTSPQNRKAIFEEFGGYKCGYCTDGHDIINLIEQYYLEDFIPINIQVSDYAIPNDGFLDLRSDYGWALTAQTGLIGYPAGTVNRHVFPGLEQGNSGTTAINRNNWNNAVGQILDLPSPVNVAAVADWDLANGEMTIDVELFYTADSDYSKNYIHIAVLQDSIVAPQLDGETWVDDYMHRHVLRDMVTGQWGEEIMTTTEGHFEARTYTYALPSYFRNVIVDPSKISLVVYVTEDHQEVLNGTAVYPEIQLSTLDAHITQVSTTEEVCGSFIEPSFMLRNDGVQHIQDMEIRYSANGGAPSYFSWSGDLCTFDSEMIQLPSIEFAPNYYGEDNWIDIEILEVNNGSDDVAWNNNNSANFEIATSTSANFLEVQILTDFYGFETYWELLDENGSILASGGNQNVGLNGGGQQNALPSDPGAYGSNQLVVQEVQIDAEACYEFRIFDDYGDGMCCNYGGGFFRLIDETGEVLMEGGDFEVKEEHPFQKGDFNPTNTEEVVEDELFSMEVFPNPSPKGMPVSIRLTNLPSASSNTNLSVFNVNGQLLHQQVLAINEDIISIPSTNWPTGTYFVQLTSPEKTISQKLIIQ